MPIWKWKLVTTAEYMKLKKKVPNKKEIARSLIWEKVYWYWAREDWFPLWTWKVLEEKKWWKVIVLAKNNNIYQNPLGKSEEFEIDVREIKVEKK